MKYAFQTEVPLSALENIPKRCGWHDCRQTYTGNDLPNDWCALIITDGPHGDAMFATEHNGQRTGALDLLAVSWRHDKMLCPEHTRALDKLLGPGTGGADPLNTPQGNA